MIEDRTRIQSQIEYLLEEGRIKLSSYVSDLLGVTSRWILGKLAEGTAGIAQLARESAHYVRASEEDLLDALNGELHQQHRMLLGMHLNRIKVLDGDIKEWKSNSERRWSSTRKQCNGSAISLGSAS